MARPRKKPPIVEPFGGRPQPAKAATGLPYGEHQALVGAQQAIPLPGGGAPNPSASAPPAPPALPTSPGAGAPPADPTAGALAAMQAMTPPTPLSAPSQRPGEPYSAGIGMTPQAPPPTTDGFAGAPSDPALWLRAIYSQAPTNGILDIISHMASQPPA